MKLVSYPKYKDSGVNMIGDIPEDWDCRKIKHITDVKISNVDKKRKPEEPEVLLCNYTDVYNNEYITHDLDFMKATASIEQIKKLSLKKGDIIITKDSEAADDIAVPALVNETLENVICGYHLALIRPNDKIQGDYLFRLLESKQINDQFIVAANGVTRFGISTYPIKNAHLMIPPIKEQQIISSFLDKKTSEIELTIEKDTQLIELLNEKRTALINHVVTRGLDHGAKMNDPGVEWIGEVPEDWEVRKLKLISTIVLGKMLNPSDKGGYYLKPYLRAQNISWENVNISGIKEMWFSKNELNIYRLRKDDLLVSEGGEVGRTAIWADELNECYIQNSVHKVTLNSENNPRYFLYAFEACGKSNFFLSIVNRVSIAHLTREKLKEVIFPVPSLIEQKRIANYLDLKTGKIDQTISEIQDKINLLVEYKKSLIHHVVTGKVDVREVVV